MTRSKIECHLIPFLFLALVAPAFGQVQFFEDEDDWLAEVTHVQVFSFDATNTCLANELTCPPTPVENQLLGESLNFFNNDTGMHWSFELRALEPDANLVFHESDFDPIQNTISIGQANDGPAHSDDDWEVSFTDCDVYVFGFDVVDNSPDPLESIEVFGPGDVLLDTTAPTDSGPVDFIGIISDSPITRIRFNEENDGDDIAVANFRFFGNPPPMQEVYLVWSSVPFKITCIPVIGHCPDDEDGTMCPTNHYATTNEKNSLLGAVASIYQTLLGGVELENIHFNNILVDNVPSDAKAIYLTDWPLDPFPWLPFLEWPIGGKAVSGINPRNEIPGGKL
jgi:hypothetical protein